MSVLIKEMKFPKNCEDCPLGEESDSLYYSCYPQGLDYTHDSKSGRMPNCPLVEIKPHGRLVDIEQLKEKIISVVCHPGENHGCHDCYRMENCKILKVFEDAPAIIEAEDET